MTFIDLFAGIGGFRYALSSFGCKCVFSSEWDKYCRESYNLNFGEIPYGDITIIDENTPIALYVAIGIAIILIILIFLFIKSKRKIANNF